MFRKLMLTGILGIGTVVGLIATPTTAQAAPAYRVVHTNRRVVVYRHGYRHWRGVRYVAPRVICPPAPIVINPCP